MINANRGDRGNEGVNHVRGVETSSQAGLQNPGVSSATMKPKKSDGGRELKKRRRPVVGRFVPGLDGVIHLLQQSIELFIRNLGTGNSQPFVKSKQVWRSVPGRAMAGRPQDAVEHCNHGALPVGAGDMDDARSVVRVFQRVQDCPNRLQPKHDAFGTAGIKVV